MQKKQQLQDSRLARAAPGRFRIFLCNHSDINTADWGYCTNIPQIVNTHMGPSYWPSLPKHVKSKNLSRWIRGTFSYLTGSEFCYHVLVLQRVFINGLMNGEPSSSTQVKEKIFRTRYQQDWRLERMASLHAWDGKEIKTSAVICSAARASSIHQSRDSVQK